MNGEWTARNCRTAVMVSMLSLKKYIKRLVQTAGESRARPRKLATAGLSQGSLVVSGVVSTYEMSVCATTVAYVLLLVYIHPTIGIHRVFTYAFLELHQMQR